MYIIQIDIVNNTDNIGHSKRTYKEYKTFGRAKKAFIKMEQDLEKQGFALDNPYTDYLTESDTRSGEFFNLAIKAPNMVRLFLDRV